MTGEATVQRRRIVLCSSSGGVLLDLLGLRPWWERHDTSWIAVAAPDAGELLADQPVRWMPEASPDRPARLAASVRAARRHLDEVRPDLVVSAGTGVAVPVFVAARSRGVASWWVETHNLVGRPGLAARVCGAMAERVLVQRPELLGDRRRSVLVSELY